MLNIISKIFGSKSDRDVKSIRPIVAKINEEFQKLANISNDELRDKTLNFKHRIQESLSDINGKIIEIKNTVEQNPNLELFEKTAFYDEVDRLEKERNKQLEVVLMDILPEAFAVMKETAKRFTNNETIEVTATAFDRELAAKKSNVIINGDKAIHHNSWLAAGSEVKWNMVHYDVQL